MYNINDTNNETTVKTDRKKRYTAKKVLILQAQEKKLKNAIQQGKGSSITVINADVDNSEFAAGNSNKGIHSILLLTPKQIKKLESSQIGTHITLLLSRSQVKANTKHSGGFLSLIASLIAGVVATAASSAVAKAIGSGIEPELECSKRCSTKKHDKKNLIYHTSEGECLQATPEKNGNGLFLRPHRSVIPTDYNYMTRHGEGMYWKTSTGKGLKKIGSKMEFGTY